MAETVITFLARNFFTLYTPFSSVVNNAGALYLAPEGRMRRIDAAVDNGYLNPFAGAVGGQPSMSGLD